MMKYIVVQTGTFADGLGSGSYQIARLESGTYHVIGLSGQALTERECGIMANNWPRQKQSAIDVCHELLSAGFRAWGGEE